MKLSQKTIDEINRYTSPNNMLVANKAGLYRLRVPIKIRCLLPVNGIDKENVAEVSAVRVTTTNRLVYLIKGRYYPYQYFEILTQK